MTADVSAFVAGERPDDLFIYLADEALSNADSLSEYGTRVGDGVVLVLDAERGRRVAVGAMGIDPMDVARRAMDTVSEISLDPVSGTCPAARVGSVGTDLDAEVNADTDIGTDTDISTDTETAADDVDTDTAENGHALRYVFAFAEKRNEDVGGIYAEGDVIHAYAVCSCGETYSDRWVASED